MSMEVAFLSINICELHVVRSKLFAYTSNRLKTLRKHYTCDLLTYDKVMIFLIGIILLEYIFKVKAFVILQKLNFCSH